MLAYGARRPSMRFLEKMNAAMDYIEGHLDLEVDYRELASLVGCSEYHLSRMFPFLTGQSLSLYIRRRRLTQAALELGDSKGDLLPIAVRYGYSSVETFSRAFREVHGTTPSLVRDHRVPVKAFAKLAFTLNVQGVTAMVYRLVTKDAFRLVGVKKTVPLVYSGPNPEIDAMWRALSMEKILRWKSLSDTEPRGIISASTNFSEERMNGGGTLDHYIGAATTQPASGEDSCLEVEAGEWAVFEAVGDFPRNLQNLWGRIYSEWFPTSPYEVRQGPELLWNEGPDTSKPNFRSEIWVPVGKKPRQS